MLHIKIDLLNWNVGVGQISKLKKERKEENNFDQLSFGGVFKGVAYCISQLYKSAIYMFYLNRKLT